MTPRRVAVAAALTATAGANALSLRWPFLNEDWAFLLRFSVPGGFRYFTQPARTPLYRPLAWGGLALQHTLFGTHPLPYHVVALVFLIGASAGVFVSCERVGLRPAGAAIGAVVFGAHPAQAWGVGWMVCVGSPMGEFFAAWTLVLLLPGRPSRRAQAAGALLLLCAIASHETFAAFPAAVTLLRFAGTRGEEGLFRRAREAMTGTLLSWALALAVVVTQSLTQVKAAPGTQYYEAVTAQVPRNMLRMLEQLTGIVLADQSHLTGTRVTVVAVIAWMALLAAAVAAARAGRTTALWGLVATVPCVVPVSLLVNQVMSAYYLEVALLPFAVAAGSIAQTLLDAYPAQMQLRAALPAAVLAAAVGGVAMTQYWTESILNVSRTREAAMLAQVRARYGGHPPARLALTGNQYYDAVASTGPAMFAVVFHDPKIAVSFSYAPGQQPGTGPVPVAPVPAARR